MPLGIFLSLLKHKPITVGLIYNYGLLVNSTTVLKVDFNSYLRI